jgi:hypothetical protein
MPYNPGVNDISGQLRAQGMMRGGEGLLAGLTGGINALQQKKEEDKANIASIKSFESMMKGLEGIADQLDPKFKEAVDNVRIQVSDPALSNKQRAQIGAQGMKGITELMKIGADVKQQQAIAKQQETENALRLLQLERSGGATPTEAQRNADAIIQAEIASGKLNPQDNMALSQRRASLLAYGGRDEREGQQWQNVGTAQKPDGSYGGQILFNQKTSKYKVVMPEGMGGEPAAASPDGAPVAAETGVAPVVGGAPGMRPTTATGLNKDLLDMKSFRDLRKNVFDDERGLERLSRYNKSVGGASQGIDVLADKFAVAASTLFGDGKLTQEQLNLVKSEGELQTLIGTIRLQTLGGGVLTEQDALRLVTALGGDMGAMRNKERVKAALTDMYRDKYLGYQQNLEDYNVQVKGKYGSVGYKEATPIEFDSTFLKGESATAGQAPADPAKAIQDERAKLAKELAELRKEMGLK